MPLPILTLLRLSSRLDSLLFDSPLGSPSTPAHLSTYFLKSQTESLSSLAQIFVAFLGEIARRACHFALAGRWSDSPSGIPPAGFIVDAGMSRDSSATCSVFLSWSASLPSVGKNSGGD